jgi:hypothetical protein
LPFGEKFHAIGIAAIYWAIWKTRNGVCFEGKVITSPITIICQLPCSRIGAERAGPTLQKGRLSRTVGHFLLFSHFICLFSLSLTHMYIPDPAVYIPFFCERAPVTRVSLCLRACMRMLYIRVHSRPCCLHTYICVCIRSPSSTKLKFYPFCHSEVTCECESAMHLQI